MKQKRARTDVTPRLMSLPEAADYAGLGICFARTYFEKIGVIRKFGRRVLIDRVALDAALDEMYNAGA